MKKISKILTALMLTSVAFANGQSNELQDDINLIKNNLSDSKQQIRK